MVPALPGLRSVRSVLRLTLVGEHAQQAGHGGTEVSLQWLIVIQAVTVSRVYPPSSEYSCPCHRPERCKDSG